MGAVTVTNKSLTKLFLLIASLTLQPYVDNQVFKYKCTCEIIKTLFT